MAEWTVRNRADAIAPARRAPWVRTAKPRRSSRTHPYHRRCPGVHTSTAGSCPVGARLRALNNGRLRRNQGDYDLTLEPVSATFNGAASCATALPCGIPHSAIITHSSDLDSYIVDGSCETDTASCESLVTLTGAAA